MANVTIYKYIYIAYMVPMGYDVPMHFQNSATFPYWKHVSHDPYVSQDVPAVLSMGRLHSH